MMIVTLTGSNSFLLQRELHGLVAAFVKDYGDIGLERINGDEVEGNQISGALTSLPFLADKKMVVLKQGSANKQFGEQAEGLLSNLPDSTDLILVEPKLDKRSSYYKYLKKATDFREFADLDQAGLARWLVATAKDNNWMLSPADARYLVERVGANQQLLASELEKLSLYNVQISRQTIDLLTDAEPQSTVFQLLESAFAGNIKQTLGLYAEQRALKVEPPQIIAMLTWQLHIVAIIKTARDKSPSDIAKEAKLSPYVVQKSTNIARNVSLGQLKALIAKLVAIDIRSKRQNLDLDEALQEYLLTLRT